MPHRKEFWRRLEPAWRITGGMATSFRPLETHGLWPGDEPVWWQTAVTKNPTGRPLKSVTCSSRTSPQVCCPSKPPTVGPRAGRVNSCVIGRAGRTVVCFSNIRNFEPHATRRFQPLSIDPQELLHFGGGWHGHCKAQVCMRAAFNKMNHERGSELRAPFANARRRFQAL